MNFEIEESDYSASVDVGLSGVHVHYVFVTVAGVTFDIKNLMPPEAWEALYQRVRAKYEEMGGDGEEMLAKSLKLKEQDPSEGHLNRGGQHGNN